MKKLLSILLFACLLQAAFGQAPTIPSVEARITNSIQWLRSAHQSPPGFADLLKKLKETETTLNATDVKAVMQAYPIIDKVTNLLIYGLKAAPPHKDTLCTLLNSIFEDYDAIKKLGQVRSDALYQDYKAYKIDINFLNTLYTLKVCRANSISKKSCLGRAEEEAIPETTLPTKPEGNNNKNHKTTSAIETLQEAIRSGKISNVLELSEMNPNDARLVPGQNGVPYEIRFKNAKTLDIVYFEPAEYTIKDQREAKNDNYWECYEKAINDFSTLVVGILKDYGGSNFHIFIQGSADAPTFKPKKLDELYNTSDYHSIKVFKLENKRVIEDTVIIGDSYTNNDLPDLRAAFFLDMITHRDGIDGIKDKFSIVKGSVKPYNNDKKRNVCVFIYIDWQKALEYEKNNH